MKLVREASWLFGAVGGPQTKPHCDVCSAVLNLPSQVWPRLECSALACAYRVTLERLKPFKWVLAQDRSYRSTSTAGWFSYTTIRMGR